MGLGSILGKILPFAAMAIPGVGPALGGILGGMGSGIMDGLETAGNVGNVLSPILGGAAGSVASGRQVDNRDQILRDQLNQGAAIANNRLPGQRMSTGLRSEIAANGPMKLNWGGAGSGASGHAFNPTGGIFEPRSAKFKQLANNVLDQELSNQMTGGDKVPGATPGAKAGALEKGLGIGAFGSAILGGLNKSGVFGGGGGDGSYIGDTVNSIDKRLHPPDEELAYDETPYTFNGPTLPRG
jgi:hypothetical protein